MAIEGENPLELDHRGGALTTKGVREVCRRVTALIPKDNKDKPVVKVVAFYLDHDTGQIKEAYTKKDIDVEYAVDRN